METTLGQPITPPPNNVEPEQVELQALPVDQHSSVESQQGNTDPHDAEEDEPDVSLPLGVKLTGYRLFNMVMILVIGLAKFILSLKGQSVAPTGLEWVAGSAFAAILYWIGLYETVEPPRWEWFLHVDWAPGIAFVSKCFLGGGEDSQNCLPRR
ncbi:hypothetical protein B0F90DRAFT_1819603 [Multifurca ochricompacta]|uniref:Uncharacterized protein n=1 Tax=Multifurca ochricompacta TaxID=376703 RepID=A0AAD4LZV3_9AGAM|nr:hypothetical protein B0F90DRAFT_1819603 [Multifurca ochricompacta]